MMPGWIPYAMWKLYGVSNERFYVSLTRQMVYWKSRSLSFTELKEGAGIMIDEDGGWTCSRGSYSYGFYPRLQ
jgi:hypothetical protein